MKACIEYLKKAKENKWAISFNDLMHRFNLTKEEVKKCVDKVYK